MRETTTRTNTLEVIPMNVCNIKLEACTDIVCCDLCKKQHKEGIIVKPENGDWLFIGMPCMKNLVEEWEVRKQFDREEWMKRWDSWVRYYKSNGGASWPRDAFESLLDLIEEVESEENN